MPSVPSRYEQGNILDDALANQMICHAKDVFRSLFDTQIHAGNYSFNTGIKGSGDLTGVVTIHSENYRGIFTVSFDENSISKFLHKVYGEDYKIDQETLIDGVGELTNMAYANVKKDLKERGLKLEMSIPAVIVGSKHVLFPFASGPSLFIPFECEVGKFNIQFTVEANGEYQ